MKIIVGSGNSWQLGWHSLRQQELDLCRPEHWSQRFRLSSIDAILAEHVWEHLTPEQGFIAARICYRFLRPGGHLRIAVPDGFHPSPTYINFVRPGNRWNGWDHRVLYDYLSLSALLSSAGFNVRLLEYWDGQGRLIVNYYRSEDGHIRRSTKDIYSGLLGLFVGCRYTSLVVDAVKPCTDVVGLRPKSHYS